MDSLRGSLLLAGGQLFDPNFRRSVVLIAEHNADGAFGVILNRPASLTVREAVPSFGTVVEPGAPLFLGGPVQKDSVIVVGEYEEAWVPERTIVGTVALAPGGDVDVILGLRRAKVFAGYSGWGPGQLEAELAEDAWIIEPARPDDVFFPEPERLWTAVLRRKGGDYRMLALMPFDVASN